MGKGGGSSDQTVTQTNLPEYAQPYVERLFERGETESQRPYEVYGNERQAGFTDPQQAGMSGIEGQGSGIQGMDLAQAYTAGGAGQAQNYIGMGPGNYSQFGYGDTSRYASGEAGGIVGTDLTNAQGMFGGQSADGYMYDDVERFGSPQVQQYMSPYMQNVVDVQKDQAQLDFERAQSGRDATAVAQGAFGGSRGAVVDALAQEDLSRQMGRIQAEGQQAAYGDAQRMFGADREAIMRRENERAQEFGRTQGMGMEDYYSAMGLRQSARGLGFDVLSQQEADRLAREQGQADELGRVQAGTDQSRQAMASLGLDAIGQQGAMAGQLADLGGIERQAETDYYRDLMDVGGMQQDQQQMLMDQQYQDFLAQQAYPREQLDWYGSLLRGNTQGSTMTQQQFEQANPYRELLGAGISALSMSQLGG